MWLKLYIELLDDPKVQKLPCEVFRTWINLLCSVKKHNKNGEIPPRKDLLFYLRMDEIILEEHFKIMVDAGLIDGNFIHNWDLRQPAYDTTNAERQKRYREKNKKQNNVNSNALRNVTVTAIEEDKDKDIDKDIKKKEYKEKTPDEPATLAPKKPPRKKYGEFGHVLLTDEQKAKLDQEHSNSETLIKTLDEAIELKGYVYKNHYLAIKKWVVRATEEQKLRNPDGTKRKMTYAELMLAAGRDENGDIIPKDGSDEQE